MEMRVAFSALHGFILSYDYFLLSIPTTFKIELFWLSSGLLYFSLVLSLASFCIVFFHGKSCPTFLFSL